MFFGGKVNASSPLDFSEIFSPLSAPLQRFPAKPSLRVCKQRPTQNPVILILSSGIFQHLSDVCWARQILPSPQCTQQNPFLSISPEAIYGMCMENTYSKLCTAKSSSWIVSCASEQIKQQCIFSEVSLNSSEVTGFSLKTEISQTHLDKVGQISSSLKK